MGRLSIVVALLVVLVALAEASTYRTTITTTKIGDGDREGGWCSGQLSKVRLEDCRRYLQPGRQQFNIVRSSDVPYECCDQIKQVEKYCRCEAIEQTMQRITGTGGKQGEQIMKVVVKKAELLPNMCGMEPRYCKIHQSQEEYREEEYVVCNPNNFRTCSAFE